MIYQVRAFHTDPGDLIDGDVVNRGRDSAPPPPPHRVGRDMRGLSYKSEMKHDSGVIEVSD